METPIHANTNYSNLVSTIAQTLEDGRNMAARAVNTQLLQTYWQIGQYIVEYEQNGSDKATYGKLLIDNLAIDLSAIHGKGFSRSNLIYMRLLYLKYPISQKPSHLLIFQSYLIGTFQLLTALITFIGANMFAFSKNCHIFDTNNTCHASRKNSAPGQVFAFYRLLVFKPLNTLAYALQ
jgi:hypothetical protein